MTWEESPWPVLQHRSFAWPWVMKDLLCSTGIPTLSSPISCRAFRQMPSYSR